MIVLRDFPFCQIQLQTENSLVTVAISYVAYKAVQMPKYLYCEQLAPLLSLSSTITKQLWKKQISQSWKATLNQLSSKISIDKLDKFSDQTEPHIALMYGSRLLATLETHMITLTSLLQ